MPAPKKLLVLDLGMQSLRLAEFAADAHGSLKLLRGARREFLLDPSLEASRPEQIRIAVQHALKANAAAAVLDALSGLIWQKQFRE